MKQSECEERTSKQAPSAGKLRAAILATALPSSGKLATAVLRAGKPPRAGVGLAPVWPKVVFTVISLEYIVLIL